MDQPIIEEDGLPPRPADSPAAKKEEAADGLMQAEPIKQEEAEGAKEEMADEAELERKRQEIEDLLNLPPEMQ
jgi:hypothetical protein